MPKRPYELESQFRVGSADLFAVRQVSFLPGLPLSQATHCVACFIFGRG